MSRHLVTGLLLVLVVLNSVLLYRTTNAPAPQPVTSAPTVPEPARPFVELRFQLPQAVAPAPAGIGHVPQGTLTNTQNPLDAAIEGVGFYQVTDTNGELRYTRRGRFRLNASGNLATAEGYLVSPLLTVPSDSACVAIASDGTVAVQRSGALNASTIIGQLTLARFVNPTGLEETHDRLLRETPASGCPIIGAPGTDVFGVLRQGFQEQHRDEKLQTVLRLLSQIAVEEGRPTVRQVP